MSAVWLVRSRQLIRKFRFWLTIVGYNPRDRSLSHKIYLLYAAVFFTAWGFAVLLLLADGTAGLLEQTALNPVLAAVALTLVIVLVWNLLYAYSASRSSPLVFSEDDAYILCQTPVSRRAVTFAWLVGDWPEQNVLTWGVAVTLGFALVEIARKGTLGVQDLPYYIFHGLLALSIMLPIQLSLLELSWALGIWRLRKDQDLPYLSLVPLGLAGLLVVMLSISTSGALLSRLVSPPFSLLAAPLLYPLQAAYGSAPWNLGFAIALAWAILGAACLWLISPDLNLSRAAQESSIRAYRFAILPLFGGRPSGRLLGGQPGGSGRAPTRLPGSPGWASLLWKDSLQTSRRELLPRLGLWLMSFGLAWSVVLSRNWGVQLWALFFWALLIYTQSTYRLQNDLSHWSLLRQLPYPAERLVLAELAGSWAAYTLCAWIAALAGALLQPSITSLWAFILAPVLVAGLALASAYDVMRRSKSMELLAGNVPQPDVLGLALGAFLLLVTVWLLSGAVIGLPPASSWSFSLAIDLILVYGFWKLAASRYREIQ